MDKKKLSIFISILFLILFSFSCVIGQEESELTAITVDYNGVSDGLQTITVNYSDTWLLGADDEYNHQLMRASFVLAAAGFRDPSRAMDQRDYNILNFFNQAGYKDVKTLDYHLIPSIDTIGTAIAHKKTDDYTLVAVSVSGNNYQGEWPGNLMIDDENRAKGFNDAAERVMARVIDYVNEHQLSGKLRLWTAGFSRSAAVANIFAADAVDSGIFDAVFAYTFATPRTNRDENSDRYHNIFNLINPFDVVPMVPFPEWGFHRYGIDLFLPSIETDSEWFDLTFNFNEVSGTLVDGHYDLNPQMDNSLHTVLDYIAFFISSSYSYTETFQRSLVNFMSNKNVGELVKSLFSHFSFESIRDRFLRRNAIAKYNMHEFYNFVDYIMQFLYSIMRGNKASIYWDSDLSLMENVAFNHFDKTYRLWLFSDNSPENLLTRSPEYAHLSIKGNVDVEVFDKDGKYICAVRNDGEYLIEMADIHMPYFQGEYSNILLYGDREGDQTLIVLPQDQLYHYGIYSHEKQTIRVSYVVYSADKLHGDVSYVYYDDYDAGEYYYETSDPAVERHVTREELQEMGVLVEEPWSGDVVYSPTAIMRLENSGVPHPSPNFLLVFLFLILCLFIILLVKITIWICKFIRFLIRKITHNRKQTNPA